MNKMNLLLWLINSRFYRPGRRIMPRWSRLPGRLCARAGFGLNEVIGIAAGIIIAAVVVIPGLQTFAGDILENLTSWWNEMATEVFAAP